MRSLLPAMVWNHIDEGILSISARTEFYNEELTQNSETSAEWLDRSIFSMVKVDWDWIVKAGNYSKNVVPDQNN